MIKQGIKNISLIRINNKQISQAYLGTKRVYSSESYLSFKAYGDVRLELVHPNGVNPKLYINYNTANDKEWHTWKDFGYYVDIRDGRTIYIKGDNPNGLTTESQSVRVCKFKTTGDGVLKVEGNVMALLDNGKNNMFTIPCNYCFKQLFKGCSIITAPKLPAARLKHACYLGMFEDCTHLTTAPELPATTLASECYYNMFRMCTNLTTVPILPATTLAESCYNSMFYYCNNLVTVPPKMLPATTLAEHCYYSMFQYCSSLVTAPELPATDLVNHCYWGMFQACSNLNYIKCLAVNGINQDYSTNSWVSNVASSGTFVKNPNATSWTNDSNGIPSGWTVQDA